MIWLGLAIGVAVIVLLLAIAVQRWRTASPSSAGRDVDPLFTTGTVITGAAAALALSLGGVMYVVMIVTAIGANRSRHPHH